MAFKLAILTGLLLGLPLLGVALAGRPVAQYLEFPPVTRYVEHAPFDWTAFALLAGVWLALFGLVLSLFVRDRRRGGSMTWGGRWPLWGWLGLGWLALAWLLAWTRFDWFAALQPHTFTPLWLGYIVVINAATYARSGKCMVTHEPGFLLGLFPASTLFWWYFEFLNRFVQNWFYIGATAYTPTEYVVHASLAFSTVLPAVVSTMDWWQTFADREANWRHCGTAEVGWRVYGWVGLLVACCGLIGIGVWPNLLYPLVWAAPLFLVVSLQLVFREATVVSRILAGSWSSVYVPALAALQCGVFWEMWNYHSLSKWMYSIPYVHRFEIFEMPVLGYAGYLPFGLECMVVVGMIGRTRRQCDQT